MNPATLIAKLKLLYPSPTTALKYNNLNEFGYCVGGALVMYTNPNTNPNPDACFPTPPLIANALQILNLELARTSALRYSYAIIDRNDRDDIAGAWNQVRLAIGERS